METSVWGTILAAAVSVVVTLTVTLIFNKLVALPAAIRAQRAAEEEEKNQMREEIAGLKARVLPLESQVAALPSYRQQSLEIQGQLKTADSAILEACQAIQAGVKENQEILNARLDRLEHREKNSLRQKILQEYRLFTDPIKNPMRAWSEMEHHSFFEIVRDYEDLGGNDYVHSEVIPSVNRLTVIPMSDQEALYKLMQSRTLGC